MNLEELIKQKVFYENFTNTCVLNYLRTKNFSFKIDT